MHKYSLKCLKYQATYQTWVWDPQAMRTLSSSACQLSQLFISMLSDPPKCGAISFTQIPSNVFYFVIKRAKGIYSKALVKLAPALAPYLRQRSSFPEIKSSGKKFAYVLTT